MYGTLNAVTAAPRLRDSSTTTRLVLRPGDTLNISCQPVAGTPTPVITWSHGGLPVMTSPRADVTGGRLIVTSLQLVDGGVYRCTARNVVGEDYRVFRLVVEGEYYTCIRINRGIIIVTTHAYCSRVVRVFTAVCLLVFTGDISKSDAARITKLDMQMLHDKSWNLYGVGVPGNYRGGT